MRTPALFLLGLAAAGCTGSGGDPGSGDSGGGPGDSGGPGELTGSGPYFAEPMFWNRDVSRAHLAPDSASIIAGLRATGGWGSGDRLRIDFSFDVLRADEATPRRAFAPTADFFAPDCDPAPVPLPPGGNLEGEPGYACIGGGDCHLIVLDEHTGALYEMWRADLDATAFRGGCLAVWDTARAYADELRGDHCASADAAGLPIAPLLFTADEVAAGEIAHAIRFVLPADRMGSGYVRPATHALDAHGPANAPPFGVHLRLRADYPVDALPSAGARTVARALQRYGMYHADRGEIALTAASDRRSAAAWAGLLGERDLEALAVEDFEVVDHGPRLPLAFRCAR
jgi:serine/threonine-protein kinase